MYKNAYNHSSTSQGRIRSRKPVGKRRETLFFALLSRNYGYVRYVSYEARAPDGSSWVHPTPHQSQVTSRQRALVASLEQKRSGSVLCHRDSAHQIPDAHGPLSQRSEYWMYWPFMDRAQVHRSGASPNPDLKRSQPLSGNFSRSWNREALTFVCEALTCASRPSLL